MAQDLDAAQSKSRSGWARFRRQISKSWPAKIGVGILTVLLLMILFAPQIATHDPTRQHLRNRLEPPSREYLLGTDHLGRDIFSRVIHGSRISVSIGVMGVLTGMIVGTALGLMAGYYGGKLDHAILWLCDLLLAFPGMLLAITIMSVLGSGMINVVMAIGIWSIPTVARLTRGQILSLKNSEFVDAARAIGAGDSRIIILHLLANSFSVLLVFGTMRIATAILTVASLSFLGLGIAPPTPEWGSMVAIGRDYIREAPHVITSPGLVIFFTVMACNFLGDTLQDALDPRMVGRD